LVGSATVNADDVYFTVYPKESDETENVSQAITTIVFPVVVD